MQGTASQGPRLHGSACMCPGAPMSVGLLLIDVLGFARNKLNFQVL